MILNHALISYLHESLFSFPIDHNLFKEKQIPVGKKHIHQQLDQNQKGQTLIEKFFKVGNKSQLSIQIYLSWKNNYLCEGKSFPKLPPARALECHFPGQIVHWRDTDSAHSAITSVLLPSNIQSTPL